MSGQRASKARRTNTSAVKVTSRPSVQTQTVARETGGNRVSLDGIRDAQASMGQLSKALSGFFGSAYNAAEIVAETALKDDLHAAKIKNAQETQQAIYDANKGRKDDKLYEGDWDYKLAHDRATQSNEIAEDRRAANEKRADARMAKRREEGEARTRDARKAGAGDPTSVTNSAAAGAYGSHVAAVHAAEAYKNKVRSIIDKMQGASPDQIVQALNVMTDDYVKGVANGRLMANVPEKYKEDVLAVVRSSLRDAARRMQSKDGADRYQAQLMERRASWLTDFDNATTNWDSFSLQGQIKSYSETFRVGPEAAKRAVLKKILAKFANGSVPQKNIPALLKMMRDQGVQFNKEQVQSIIRERQTAERKQAVTDERNKLPSPHTLVKWKNNEKHFDELQGEIKVRIAQGDGSARADLDALYNRIVKAAGNDEVSRDYLIAAHKSHARALAAFATQRRKDEALYSGITAGKLPTTEEQEAKYLAMAQARGGDGARTLQRRGYVPFAQRKEFSQLASNLSGMSSSELRNNPETAAHFNRMAASLAGSYALKGTMSGSQWAKQFGAHSGLALQMAENNIRTADEAKRLVEEVSANSNPDYFSYVGFKKDPDSTLKGGIAAQQAKLIKSAVGDNLYPGSVDVLRSVLKARGGRIAAVLGLSPRRAMTEEGLATLITEMKNRGIITVTQQYGYDGSKGEVRYNYGNNRTPIQFPEDVDVSALTNNITGRITSSMSKYGLVKTPFVNGQDMKGQDYTWKPGPNNSLVLSVNGSPLKVYSGQRFFTGETTEFDHGEMARPKGPDGTPQISGSDIVATDARRKKYATANAVLPAPDKATPSEAAAAFKKAFRIKDPQVVVTVTKVGNVYEYTVGYNTVRQPYTVQ